MYIDDWLLYHVDCLMMKVHSCLYVEMNLLTSTLAPSSCNLIEYLLSGAGYVPAPFML